MLFGAVHSCLRRDDDTTRFIIKDIIMDSSGDMDEMPFDPMMRGGETMFAAITNVLYKLVTKSVTKRPLLSHGSVADLFGAFYY